MIPYNGLRLMYYSEADWLIACVVSVLHNLRCIYPLSLDNFYCFLVVLMTRKSTEDQGLMVRGVYDTCNIHYI